MHIYALFEGIGYDFHRLNVSIVDNILYQSIINASTPYGQLNSMPDTMHVHTLPINNQYIYTAWILKLDTRHYARSTYLT